MQLVSNKMYLLIPLIGLMCVAPGLAQRGFRQVQQCYTPQNGIGQCLALTYCPFIANVLNEYPRNIAVQYLRAAQRSCGNVNYRGDPVVCCDVNGFEQTTTTTTEVPSRNPFFPTNPPTNPPFIEPQTQPTNPPNTLPPIIIAPTPAPQPSTTEGISSRESSETCTNIDLRVGTCKPLAQCSSLLTRLQQNPKDATFVSFIRKSNEICKLQYAVVCCPDANQEQYRQLPVFPRNSQDIPTKLPTKADGCGFVNNEFKKIVGGTASKPGAWPWIALIGYDDGISASPFKCGGTLITSRHVLTAAHCIRADLTFVRLGEHDLSTDTETNHIDIPVVKRLRHPRYNRTDGHNDIALLYLGQNVEFSEKITPICIPFEGTLRNADLTDFTPFVAGWGKTMEGGRSANILQELQIPVYGNDVCKNLYKKQNKFLSEEQFDNAVLCAGDLGGGKDTCQGDSGGPLMLPENYERSVRYNLMGVVSYGIGCARPMIPGVYARVTNFIDWIQNGVADTPYHNLLPQPTNPPNTLPVIIAPTPKTTTPAPQPSTTEGISSRESSELCANVDDTIGTCKPLVQCSSLVTKLQQDPNDATFITFIKKSNEICKLEYAVVCCPDANQQQYRQLPVFPRNSQEIPTKLPTKADGCGFVDNNYLKNGVAISKVGVWPWIALIGYDDGISASPFKCGGTLITSRHVLTAAHCIRADLTFVRLGEHDLSTDTEANHIDIPVVKHLRHPRYNRTDGHNDIALLYLGQNVEFSEKITPICIPFEGSLRSKDITDWNPFVAGWGKTMEGGKSANIVQDVQIRVYGNDVCKNLYKKQNKFLSEEQFDNAVLCAGIFGGRDICLGDSGGFLMLPEMYEKSYRFNLMGVMSYGCAISTIPGVYARVTNFIDWIQNGVADTPSFLNTM